MRIDINGVGSELQGVGRLPDGRAVFVPGAIPGETVDIEITADKGRFCEASLVEVCVPSPDRVAPNCPNAGRCGGCHARHMRYERTLQLKRQVVCNALTRIGGQPDPIVHDTLGCALPDRTRNKAEYPIGAVEGHPAIGAFARGGRALVPLTDCLNQTEASVAMLKAVSDWLPGFPMARHLKYLVTRTNRQGKLMVVFSGDVPMEAELKRHASRLPACHSLWYCHLNRRPTHALDGHCTRLSGDPTLTMQLFDLDFELSPQAFFQVNAAQTEALYAVALNYAGIREGCSLRVLDAYCGAGTITLSAARFADHVMGIEIVPPAIENAKRNAQINGLESRTHFLCGDAAREIPRLLSRGQRFDAAILDPPRKGADAALLNALADAQIPTISYVSCNPATLARDVKLLSDRGYRLCQAQPVDMFPWTGHVETVCLLTHKD